MIQIGILGCGTVAGGTIRILTENAKEIERRIGEPVVIKKVLARTPEKARRLGLTEAQIVSSVDEIAQDPDIAIVAELMGGTGAAYDAIRACMEQKKHIVTANKDLLAAHWDELQGLALANGVDLQFEASVAGGIPIIGPVRQTLAANRITGISGILNGTTNYILSRMTEAGSSYAEALAEAQQLGYAEANPESDVEGLDAARKIVILAILAFHARFTLADVATEGITRVSAQDIADAAALGCVIKLLASGREQDGAVALTVRPTLVPKTHPLASVGDAANACFLVCDAADAVFFSGRGAGAMPTGSSVAGDIMEIARNMRTGAHARFRPDAYAKKQAAARGTGTGAFALLLEHADRAAVEAAFAEAGIALERAEQAARGALLLITGPVRESALEAVTQLLEKAGAIAESKRYAVL